MWLQVQQQRAEDENAPIELVNAILPRLKEQGRAVLGDVTWVRRPQVILNQSLLVASQNEAAADNMQPLKQHNYSGFPFKQFNQKGNVRKHFSSQNICRGVV